MEKKTSRVSVKSLKKKQIAYVEDSKKSAIIPIEKRLFFKDSEYNNLLVPVHRLPESVDIQSKYKRFQDHPEFSASIRVDRNKLLRYIILMYDFNSPFNKIKDLVRRKTLCALEAGFEQVDGRFKDNVIKIMICSDKVVNAMIIRFLSFFNNHHFSYLVALLQGYENELNNIMAGDVKNLQLIQDYIKQIEITERKMLNNDTSMELKEDLYAYIESKRLELRPEDIAIKMSKGEEILDGFKEEPKYQV
jgi:hypothetical protein